MAFVKNPSAELDYVGVVDVDPMVVVADGPERPPHTKVVSHLETLRGTLA
jgi:hypothetical protein